VIESITCEMDSIAHAPEASQIPASTSWHARCLSNASDKERPMQWFGTPITMGCAFVCAACGATTGYENEDDPVAIIPDGSSNGKTGLDLDDSWPDEADEGGTGGAIGKDPPLSDAAIESDAGEPFVPEPLPTFEYSQNANAFCKKFHKVCGFDKQTYWDEELCEASYDSYAKKQKKCVEDALTLAKKSDNKKSKHCRSAAGKGDCTP
jgi:hypothetical protein